MPNITGPALTFPTRAFPQQQSGAPSGIAGELLLSELVGKYATLVKSQKVFYASAIVTAPVIFSTAAQNGPVIWNRPGSGLDAHILGIAVSEPSTAPTVAGSIGWASGVQPTAPTLGGTAAAITAVNAYAGGGTSQMGAITSGASGNAVTVIVLPAPVFLPLIAVNTSATSVLGLDRNFVDVGGSAIIGPGNVGYVCGSATLSTGVFTIAILWAEIAA